MKPLDFAVLVITVDHKRAVILSLTITPQIYKNIFSASRLEHNPSANLCYPSVICLHPLQPWTWSVYAASFAANAAGNARTWRILTSIV